MRFGVIQFPGSCDENDALLAASRIGQAEIIWHSSSGLDGYDAIIVPGGFSYGDYLRAGAIARFSPIMDAVSDFAKSGGPVLGICNGFQILCEAGLLPGALLPNVGLHFICQQAEVCVVNSETLWTRTYTSGEILSLPVKHAHGRYFAPDSVLAELEANGQIVFRYRDNPNGSSRDIAGVSNLSGNVVGLMPHPEHAVDSLCGGSTDGLNLFAAIINE